MKDLITGIQQVGIGVTNAAEAKHLYKSLFGMDVLIFEDHAEAGLMTQYTGNEVHKRHAILSMNLAGGGGFEIWQFTSRTPAKNTDPRYGDLGIFAARIKCANIKRAHHHFLKNKQVQVSALLRGPGKQLHFWITDPYGNSFKMVESTSWFKFSNGHCGGVAGAVIGVSDIKTSIDFYRNVLGINELVYETEGVAGDLPLAFGNGQSFKSALLRKKTAANGAFCKLLGEVEIELVEALDFTPKKIYENRFWGDCGFIHLCFDVLKMNDLKEVAKKHGYGFTVDSAQSFSMGNAAGRFCYLEDPDGTLIELVETHKIPILKKLNWNLNLQTRKSQGPLPNWMISLLALNKIK